MARTGTYELLKAPMGDPHRIIPLVPDVVVPLRHAILTGDHDVITAALKVLRNLARCNDGVAGALKPYFKTLLCPLASYLRGGKLEDIVIRTLEVLERYGPEGAGDTIKDILPTYECCGKDPQPGSPDGFLGRGWFEGDDGSISML